ncbi:hypothetical protein [Halorussus halophilus]|uniref:hypothetical protein n=1 Tax=Halorussus halophilus TaxID=2650975 RepID=UPI00130127E8|nr:hypothetical protein [Halorussus halophilus]
MVLPFSTGHLLALRVWPQSSFGPYVSVWHRPPGGEWSIYSDGPSLDTTCPRYWGPATEEAALANIDVTWTGPNELRVEMDDPQLVWTLSVSAPPLLERLNAVHASLPLWTWKPSLFVRTRELLAKQVFDIGDVRFSFRTASGHDTVIMPEEEYAIPDSDATLEGQSLGSPTQLRENPTIGDVPLPTHPCFVFGEAHMRIKNPGEFQRTRERIRDTASRSNTV